MNMPPNRLVVFAATCFLTMAGSSFAHAQDEPENPRGSSVTLMASLSSGYNDDKVQQDSANGTFVETGVFSSLQTSLQYVKRSRRVNLSLAAGSGLRYYPALSDLVAVERDANATVSLPLGRRTHVSMMQSMSFSPYYVVNLLPASFGSMPLESASAVADVHGPQADYAMSRQDNLSYSTGVMVAHTLGRRSSIAWNYSARRGETAANLGAVGQSAGLRYSHQLARDIGSHLGYSYDQISTQSAYGAAAAHYLDVGIDYGRTFSLPFGRRTTTVGFTSGSAFARAADAARLELLGTVTLTHPFTRRWRVAAGFNRGLHLNAAFLDPVLANSLVVNIDGGWGRRISLSGSANYSDANVGFARGRGYGMASANTRLQFIVSKNLAADIRGSAYGHDFADAVPLPAAWSRTLVRYSAQVGLTVRLPLHR